MSLTLENIIKRAGVKIVINISIANDTINYILQNAIVSNMSGGQVNNAKDNYILDDIDINIFLSVDHKKSIHLLSADNYYVGICEFKEESITNIYCSRSAANNYKDYDLNESGAKKCIRQFIVRNLKKIGKKIKEKELCRFR